MQYIYTVAIARKSVYNGFLKFDFASRYFTTKFIVHNQPGCANHQRSFQHMISAKCILDQIKPGLQHQIHYDKTIMICTISAMQRQQLARWSKSIIRSLRINNYHNQPGLCGLFVLAGYWSAWQCESLVELCPASINLQYYSLHACFVVSHFCCSLILAFNFSKLWVLSICDWHYYKSRRGLNTYIIDKQGKLILEYCSCSLPMHIEPSKPNHHTFCNNPWSWPSKSFPMQKQFSTFLDDWVQVMGS